MGMRDFLLRSVAARIHSGGRKGGVERQSLNSKQVPPSFKYKGSQTAICDVPEKNIWIAMDQRKVALHGQSIQSRLFPQSWRSTGTSHRGNWSRPISVRVPSDHIEARVMVWSCRLRAANDLRLCSDRCGHLWVSS